MKPLFFLLTKILIATEAMDLSILQENHLMNKILKNEEYCVQSYEDGKIFLDPSKISFSAQGPTLDLNEQERIELPLLRTDDEVRYFLEHGFADLFNQRLEKEQDEQKLCYTCLEPVDECSRCQNSECLFYSFVVETLIDQKVELSNLGLFLAGAESVAALPPPLDPVGDPPFPIALYVDNAAIGFPNTAPPTSGFIVSGNTSIGSSTATALFNVGSSNQFQIDTSGIVSAPRYNLNGSTSGTISILATTGTYNFNLPIDAGTSGYFLTSAGGGAAAMTWTNPTASLVTSISGTANQVLANSTSGTPEKGDVTLTFSNGISIGSYQATSPPTGGILCPGNVVIGTTTYPVDQLVVGGGASLSTFAGSSTGYLRILSDSASSTNYIESGLTNIAGSQASLIFTDMFGSHKWMAIGSAGGIAIGTYAGSSTPPANGLIVSGNTSIGSSTATALFNVGSSDQFQVDTTGIASAPQYNLNGSTSGTISILPQAIAGTYNFNLPIDAGTSGYFLTSAGGGAAAMTWTNPTASLVTSASGTANQVLVNSTSGIPETGAVTLSFPATGGISIGTYQATLPPTGGIICPGNVGIGTSSVSYPFDIGYTNTTEGILQHLGGSIVTSTTVNNKQAALYIDTVINPSGSVSSAVASIYANLSITPSSGTTANAIGLFVDAGSSSSGTITNSYGIYVNNPAMGTNQYGAYIGGKTGLNTTAPQNTLDVSGAVAIGASYAGVDTAPPDGLIVKGQVGIGTSSVSSDFSVSIDQTTRLGTLINGSQTATDGVNQSALYIGNVFAPTASTSVTQGIWAFSAYNLPASVVIGNAPQIHISSGSVTLGAGASITTGYGLLVDGLGFGTTRYGGYFNFPSGGTANIALYTDNASIGYPGIDLGASHNLIVSGNTSIGSSATTALFNVGSSNQFQVNTTGVASAPQYNLNGSTSGTISILPQAVAGTYNFNLPIDAGTSGYFLTSAGGGAAAMTWTNPTASLVTSASGTANQVLVNSTSGTPETGAVTLSFPATGGISIGSYQATTPPGGGIICPGNVGIGTSSFVTGSNLQVGSTTTASTSIVRLVTDGAANDNPLYSLFGTGVAEQVMALDISATNGNLLFCVNPAGYTSADLQSAAKVVLNGSKGALEIGYNIASPPTNGLLVKGQAYFGNSGVSSNAWYYFEPTLSTSATLGIGLDIAGGTVTYTANGADFRLLELNSQTLNTGTFTGLIAYGQYIAVSSFIKSGTGVIDTAYGLRIDSFPSGFATNQYAAYFNSPSGGTLNTALYTDNVSIGYPATSPPGNGLIVNGLAVFGGTAPSASNANVTIGSTTSSGTLEIMPGTASGGSRMLIKSISDTNNNYTMQILSSGAGAYTSFYNGSTLEGYFYVNVANKGALAVGTALNNLTQNSLDVAGGVAIGSNYAGVYTGPSDGLIVEGNTLVGINTSSPASQLEVRASNRVVDNGSGAGMVYIGSTDNGTIDYGGSLYLGGSTDTTGPGKIVFGSISGRKENSTTANYAGYLQFATNNSGGTVHEWMRITSTGNVGIGTSSPSTVSGRLLELSANIPTFSFYDTSAAVNYKRWAFNANSGSFYGFIIADSDSGLTTNWLQVIRNGATTVTSVNFPHGNVGIGTTSPNSSAILEVSSTTQGVRFPNMTQTQRDAIVSPVTGLQIYDTSSNSIDVYNGSWVSVGTYLISKQVLGSDSASVTFSNIPSTFNNLRILIQGRCSDAAVAVNINMRLNGDTTANYDGEYLQSNNAAVGGGAQIGATSFQITIFPAASAVANHAGQATIDIINYANTTFFKNISCYGGTAPAAAASSFCKSFVGNYRSTSAVTSITFLDAVGGNFLAGSTFYLYGML